MKKILAVFAIFFAIGCNMLESPTAPSSYRGRSEVRNLTAWSPCIVVQTPGYRGDREFEVQMASLRKLHDAGRLEWVRLGDVDSRGNGRDYAIEAKRIGLKILGIMGLEDLEEWGNWENSFDRLYSIFPEVDVWEIGNEVTSQAINSRPATPEEYMEKFKRLYDHVRINYPRAVLTSAASPGSVAGSTDLQRFIELGLLEMDVIVVANVYDFSYRGRAIQEYANVFSQYREKLSRKRIWVTETGSPIAEQQVAYVENTYPKIANTLHPEMICWYVMWSGDGAGGDTGFNLINNIHGPAIEERSLFQLLTGKMQ